MPRRDKKLKPALNMASYQSYLIVVYNLSKYYAIDIFQDIIDLNSLTHINPSGPFVVQDFFKEYSPGLNATNVSVWSNGRLISLDMSNMEGMFADSQLRQLPESISNLDNLNILKIKIISQVSFLGLLFILDIIL